MTMLADDKAAEQVALGEGGIVANLAKSAIHISSSTINAGLSERLTAAHAKAGLSEPAGYIASRWLHHSWRAGPVQAGLR
jgi:hypothetical protein